MAKLEKKYGNKKDELLEIAEKLFLKKGYEETSIEDILKASGLSKGGFYHYFESKEEVLVESIKSFADNLLKELEPIIGDPDINALEKLQKFLEKKSTSQKTKKDLIAYLCMLMKSDFAFYKYTITIVQKYVEPFAKIIEQGVQEGFFKVQHPRETADILLRAVTSVPQSMFFSEYMENKEMAMKYKASIDAIMTRALGIEGSQLKIFLDVSVESKDL